MFAITTKLLGIVSGGLLITSVAAGRFAWLQTDRLSTAKNELVTERGAKDLAITVANERGTALTGRDEIIQAQTSSIDLLAAQRGQDRTVYLQGIATADKSAQGHEARAVQLVAPTPAPDDRCEAARALIEQELTSVR